MNGFTLRTGILFLTIFTLASCGKYAAPEAQEASTVLVSNPFYDGEATAQVLPSGSDGGTIGGGNPNPGGGDGGTVPDPSSTPVPSSSPTPSVTPQPSTSPTPSSTPNPTSTPAPSSSPTPSPTPSNTPAPSPSPGPGDGGTLPTPTPSPGPGDGGTVPTPTPSATPQPSSTPTPSATPQPSSTPTPSVTPQPSSTPTPSATPQPSSTPTPSVTPTPSPSTCPNPNAQSDAGFVRVCSQMRSGIKNFIFFEEALNPILTVEHTYTVKNKKTNKSETKRLVVALVNLSDIDLLANPKPTVPVDPNLELMKDLYGKNAWKTKTLKAYVCEDKKNTGTCSDKTGYDVLSIGTVNFQADRVPSKMSFEVWSGRSLLLKKNPTLCEKQYSPLVLDLKGNGISLTGPGTGVLFDLDATGTPVRTGWVNSPDDAFLVRDINGNGIIDSGAELFGSATQLPDGTRAANGFEALKALDSNQDSVFDEKDAAWGEVMLWADRNLNGATDRGEIVTLRRGGVQSIDLIYVTREDIDQYGNATKQRSTFIRRVKGVTKRQLIIDVWFNTLIPH